ncbi:unnamed protein product [Microthlaspi erraticum]|uniref:F-box domain-containing protein n=1 Tax=Microthlaspi erraticum TaxID=1685480 RepID=A0A6D2I825_9BRAS|nr:unnamed protein product [Microthlaspi erraticum]
MGDRRKSKRIRSKASSETKLKEDKLSELPDPLICQILCHLPTKEAVRTSVISTRWKTLWLWIPQLKLKTREFPDLDAFLSFGNRFFDPTRASCLDKLKLIIHDDYEEEGVDVASCLTSWINAAVKRKIQHLDIFYEIPTSLYNCETLVLLKLFWMALPDAEFVFLPCLKTMHLQHLRLLPNEATFERLISSCPVLEELRIEGDVMSDAIALRVSSRSLKRLTIMTPMSDELGGTRVVIDAPRLCFLTIYANLSESLIIADMDSLVKLTLCLGWFGGGLPPAISWFRSFLPRVLKVRDMTMSSETFELFYHYSKSERLPQFGYMSRLHLTLYVNQLEWLPTVLESCPNLKSLAQECTDAYNYNEANEICLSYVPECLLSSLEFVDIQDPS